MSMRFRKSFKIAPGVKLNIGRKSGGISVGSKYGGFSYNSKTGVRSRASIPGSGVSFSGKIFSNYNYEISDQKSLSQKELIYGLSPDELKELGKKSVRLNIQSLRSLDSESFCSYCEGYSEYGTTIKPGVTDKAIKKQFQKQWEILEEEIYRREHANKTPPKWQKRLAIASYIFLAIVIILIIIPTKTDEEKVIEIAKNVFDTYAPDYDYLDKDENWTVVFNVSDEPQTITVWAPSETPNKSGTYLRACIMFVCKEDNILPYFISIDDKTIYEINREKII